MVNSLQAIKKKHQTITEKIRNLKSYGISMLVFQAPFVTITPKQINEIQKIYSWFLFGKENLLTMQGRTSHKISKQRLQQCKEFSGFNLHDIQNHFDAYKAWFLCKLFDRKKQWNLTLRSLINKQFQQKQTKTLIHPLFVFDPKHDHQQYKWKWLQQAMRFYKKIPKTSIFPENISSLRMNTKNEITIFRDESYFPINIKKRKNKPIPIKASNNLWNKVKLIFHIRAHKTITMGNNKHKIPQIIKLKHILTNTERLTNTEPILTQGQKEHMKEYQNFNPIAFTNQNLKGRIAIQDFAHRAARHCLTNFGECSHCKMKNSSKHQIHECTEAEDKWAQHVDYDLKSLRTNPFKLPRKSYIISHQWLIRWCIWKMKNIIYFDPTTKTQAPYILPRLIRDEERRFLRKIPKQFKKDKPEQYEELLDTMLLTKNRNKDIVRLH